MKPIIFHVEVGGVYRPIELTFATESEVRRLRTWRKLTPKTEAGEFAALAAKRWYYYSREDATAASLQGLRSAINRDPHAEIAFLMVAFAEWTGRRSLLGLAYCRRTWYHHLALDFLAVQPGVLFKNQPVRGTGTGIIFGLASLAENLGIQMLWGEATSNSASFYEKVLQVRPIQDLFIIRRAAMLRLRKRYLSKIKERLAEAEMRKHY